METNTTMSEYKKITKNYQRKDDELHQKLLNEVQQESVRQVQQESLQQKSCSQTQKDLTLLRKELTEYQDQYTLIKYTKDDKAKLNVLLAIIACCDKAYHAYDTSLISDEEYDLCFKRAKTLEKRLGNDTKGVNGTTEKVGSSLIEILHSNKKSPQNKHSVPMLSIDSSDSQDDLEDFLLTMPGDIFVECKIDGMAGSVKYVDGKLTQVLSRGDGIYGEDITEVASYVDDLPKILPCYLTMEVRGEFYLPTSYRAGEKISRRHVVSGLLRRKSFTHGSIKEISQIHFIPYMIIGNLKERNIYTQQEVMQFFRQLRFRSMPASELITKDYQSTIRSFRKRVILARDQLPFEIDGIVCKVNSLAMQKKLGATKHHPRWMFGHKFMPEEANTIVKSIDWRTGPTGHKTPVAVVEPVEIGNTIIRRISLHNSKYVKLLGVKANDMVRVVRIGDVCPAITKVVKSA